MPFPYNIIVLIAVLVLGAGFYLFWRRERKKSLILRLKYKLFLIKILLDAKEEGKKELKQEIALTEQLLNSLSFFKEPVIFEVAVPHIGEEIHFYAAVPGKRSGAFMKQFQSLWSEAEVSEVDDYTIFNYGGEAAAAYVSLRENFVLPVRTYGEADIDTFLPLLGGFSKVDEIGEGAALQFVVKSAPRKFKKIAKASLSALKKGGSLKSVLKMRRITAADFIKALFPESDEKAEEKKAIDDDAVRALEVKLQKPFFEVNIRAVASASTKEKAEEILEGLVGGFSQFGAPGRNEFVVRAPRNPRELTYNFSFREFVPSKAIILNSEELASVFHFPTLRGKIPGIKILKSRESEPPPNLPKEGILIGASSHRGARKEVKIKEDDRRRHFYVVGQTGTGKSNLLVNMAVQDIREGKGVAVIDPHGDLVEDIAGLVPKERFEDVLIFNPGDVEHPVGLNMLEYDLSRPEEKSFVTNELINIFEKLYDLKATGGPMFEYYLRNALQLLMEDAPNETPTLMQVSRIFSDADYRSRKLSRIKDPTVVNFWKKEAEKAGGEAALANITPYIVSKFASFTANDYMRFIVGQEKSSFNFRDIMDKGKVLLVNLSKGRIGGLNANLLGMIITGKILMAALSRVDIPQSERKDFYLYIDEFQNFTTDSISVILAEARKYRLNLTVAHQFIAQLTEGIRDSVFGNVGSILSFRVGADDAEYLEKQFEPVFRASDLVNIDNFNAYLKLLIDGETTKPFNIKTLPAERGNSDVASRLKDYSRKKYGRERAAVEEEIYKKLTSNI